MGIVFCRFRENEGEFVASVTRGGIDGTAVNAENIGEAADGAAAKEMAEVIVDFLQAVEVEKQHGEGPAGAIGAFRLVFKNIEKAAVVGQAGERIADGEMMDLFEEPRVIEKRAAQRDDIAQDHESLGENKGSVQQARGLSSGELSSNIQPGGGINGAVERRIFDGQAAAVPDETDEENCGGQQLLRIGEKGAGMAGDFRRQAAKGSGERVGQHHDGEQGAGNFSARVARTWQEVLDEKRYKEQKSKHHAAKPPGDRRPKEAQGRIGEKLEEENAGGCQDSPRKKKPCAENQRNAVLRSLKTDESDHGENKCEKSADNLQVALKNGVGLKSNAAKPGSSENHKEKNSKMREEDCGVTAPVCKRNIAHRVTEICVVLQAGAPM